MDATDRTPELRAAFEAMVPEFGTPQRSSLSYDDRITNTLVVATQTMADETEVHPVFALAHHFRSNDSHAPGYTSNPYRGDHQSLPVLVGEEVAIIETSFHKGNAFVEMVTFPNADLTSSLYQAAINILEATETR
ncbi:hypothetical protein [Frigoribacterium sp. SL97]|uniref:hypothetical protein n=1 Tax=Frigoribacterium sp. SL97 TaxID=2994664 RepID=UPI00226D8DA3|nr:hypothetical protein [Frigoribacterium sp. SL97]WAC53235.1 hypothetical protein OVA02_08410 [Frigoribacterium sp. SL97]